MGVTSRLTYYFRGKLGSNGKKCWCLFYNMTEHCKVEIHFRKRLDTHRLILLFYWTISSKLKTPQIQVLSIELESDLPHCKTSIHSKVNAQPSTAPVSLYRIKTMSSIKCPQLSCILNKMSQINLVTHQYMILSPQRSSEWICLR